MIVSLFLTSSLRMVALSQSVKSKCHRFVGQGEWKQTGDFHGECFWGTHFFTGIYIYILFESVYVYIYTDLFASMHIYIYIYFHKHIHINVVNP